MEYLTVAARLESFQPPSKRSKTGWRHKTPTAQAMAQAGFHYVPTAKSTDNVQCFLCDRQLDGWEPQDNPISEHLKHSPDCAWAVLMDLAQHDTFNLEEMEDPTEQKMTDARRTTFQADWPHESKRGWICKTEKMVEAGFFYAPITDSDDLVGCAYCKLSLDGWEPKDEPFNDHLRRSPNCPFFAFSGITPPSKRPKAKKGRASKGGRTSKVSTRLSTQSNMTAASEITSIPDLDESIDTSTGSIMSTMSIMSTASATTGKVKRKASTKSKSTKPKRTKTTKPSKTRATEVEPTPEPEEPAHTIELESQDLLEPQGESTSPELKLPPMPETNINYPPLQNVSPSPRSAKTTTKIAHTSLHPSSPTHMTTAAPQSSPHLPSPTPKDHQSPSENSDIENAPPSARSPSVRPPLSSPGEPLPKWEAVDIETIFENTNSTPGNTAVTIVAANADNAWMETHTLSKEEQEMTVQQWIEFMAQKAETELQDEAARVVSVFEREGAKAMKVLEGLVCSS